MKILIASVSVKPHPAKTISTRFLILGLMRNWNVDVFGAVGNVFVAVMLDPFLMDRGQFTKL